MTKEKTMTEEFVLCTVIHHVNDTFSVMALHRGSMDECEEVVQYIPAVVNSTPIAGKDAWLTIVPSDEYDAAVRERNIYRDWISDD